MWGIRVPIGHLESLTVTMQSTYIRLRGQLHKNDIRRDLTYVKKSCLRAWLSLPCSRGKENRALYSFSLIFFLKPWLGEHFPKKSWFLFFQVKYLHIFTLLVFKRLLSKRLVDKKLGCPVKLKPSLLLLCNKTHRNSNYKCILNFNNQCTLVIYH